MTNLDMKKTLKHLYKPSAKEVSLVDIPPMNYLMIDGEGNPSSLPYQQSVEALYNLAYAIRFMSKDAGLVYTVMPLEGLWSIKGQEVPPEDFELTQEDKDNFIWTLMILQPDHITSEMVEQARTTASQKKQPAVLLDQVRFEAYKEGKAVQIMHIGSYVDEGPTVARLHQHIKDQGWSLGKQHHEIYLSDPRKVAPEKLKTIIRQPYATK
jgi:hypothetical protein